VVHPELALEAIGGPAVGCHHHPGVVDQQVDPQVGVPQRVGGGPDRPQRGQVQLCRGHAALRRAVQDAVRGGLGLRDVAAGQHDGGAAGGEHPRDLEADPGVGAGDDGDPARLGRDVGFGPPGGARAGLRYLAHAGFLPAAAGLMSGPAQLGPAGR